MPGFARLFLSRYRGEVEVQQYAESLFLQRELFATAERTGILLFASLFEGRVVVLPDRGVAGRLSEEAIGSVTGPMISSLARGETGHALEEGLARLLGILEATAPTGPSGGVYGNELPNEVIEGEGA
jgi:putative membrane protein